jgi:hypothetical protein
VAEWSNLVYVGGPELGATLAATAGNIDSLKGFS